jgi:hypothetical protein
MTETKLKKKKVKNVQSTPCNPVSAPHPPAGRMLLRYGLVFWVCRYFFLVSRLVAIIVRITTSRVGHAADGREGGSLGGGRAKKSRIYRARGSEGRNGQKNISHKS